MTYSETKYHTCIYCNQLLTYTEENRKEVAKHYWRSHYNLIRDNYNFSIGNLILELFYNNTYPKCDCGCKEDVTRYRCGIAGFGGSIQGHQYKTKKNIPKLIKDLSRICPQCNQLTIYDNYDSKRGAERRNSICKKCKKEKEPPNVLERNCSDCNDVIIYKNKYDCFEGTKNNSPCKVCRDKHLSNMYTGKGFIGALKERYEDGEERYKKAMLKQQKSFKEYWEEHPEQLDKLVQKRKNPKCKNFEVNGLKCQGTFEKQYILNLVDKNKVLPTKPKGINTSLGFYFPDFEFEDKFIEIKSTYTYAQLLENKFNQLEKIKEVTKNIKPVEVTVLDNKGKSILFIKIFN